MAGWVSRVKALLTPEKSDETLTNQPLAQRLTRLEQESLSSIAALTDQVAEFDKHLARLSREQFKANVLTEGTLAEVKAALLRWSQERPPTAERPSQMKTPIPNLRLLEALMPFLDSIEAGLVSGQSQCDLIADDHSREILIGWLDGQRLLRERLLALFDKENVRPIESVGQVFDPFRHVVVETMYDPLRAVGTIVEERRRGYEIDQRVLRFAEVVVTSNQQPPSYPMA